MPPQIAMRAAGTLHLRRSAARTGRRPRQRCRWGVGGGAGERSSCSLGKRRCVGGGRAFDRPRTDDSNVGIGLDRTRASYLRFASGCEIPRSP